jgi:hypothetical protein
VARADDRGAEDRLALGNRQPLVQISGSSAIRTRCTPGEVTVSTDEE